MILYTLACGRGHRFESWFRGSADFDDQAVSGLIACPVCGSQEVVKAIMAPAVVSRSSASSPSPAGNEQIPGRTGSNQPSAGQNVALLDGPQAEIRERIKAFRDKVMSESEDVGPAFPDEARKMHDGDIPHRNIRGEATIEEARSLLDEGVMVLPIPGLPDELN